MTTLKNIFGIFFLLAIIFLSSCGKTDTVEPKQEPAEERIQLDIKHKKELTIIDESGENSIVLEIASNDESILDTYQESSFILTPLYEKPEGITDEEPLNEEGKDTSDFENNEEEEVHFTILEENLAEDVVSFKLEESEDARAFASGPRWIHGSYNRGILLIDTWGCTYGYKYYRVGSWYYYAYSSWFYVCNSYRFYYRKYGYSVSLRVTSPGSYYYYFY